MLSSILFSDNFAPLMCMVIYPISSLDISIPNSLDKLLAIFFAILNSSIFSNSNKTSLSIIIVSPFCNLFITKVKCIISPM